MSSKENIKIVAICNDNKRFDGCPVFELNPETFKFTMISNSEFQYYDLDIYADKSFSIFEVTTESTNELITGSKNEYKKIEYVKRI